MAETKTKPTQVSVAAFVGAIADEARRADCRRLIALMKKATGQAPKMWGPSIIGFGSYHYRYDSGHEGDSCLVGFASRKPDLVLYVMGGFAEREKLVARLGKVKASKGCLYVRRLADVDLGVLEEIVERSIAALLERYPQEAKAAKSGPRRARA